MAFTTPCFVRVEDAAERKKLIRWLKEIGHNVCDCCLFDGWNTIHCNPLLHDSTFDVHGVPDYDAESGYNIELFKHENSLKDCPSYDAGTNVDLFRAIAAMNDENDREQWFVVDDGFEEEMVCSKSEVDYDYILSCYDHRKATAEEIVEYFKKRENDNRRH